MRHFGRALALWALLVSSGCDGFTSDPVQPVQPVTIQVSPSVIAMEVGQSATVVASVRNTANPGVNFSSSNTSVATVSATGVVTCVAPGTAVIIVASVADPTARAAVSVTCALPPMAAEVSPAELALEVGGTGTLTCTVRHATTGAAMAGEAVAWSSGNDAVAAVSAEGMVTGVSQGEAVITCAAVRQPATTATATVRVTPACGQSGSSTFAITVASDPHGHHPYVGMPGSMLLTVNVEDGAITVTGSSPFVSVSGTMDAQCAVSATGSGTVAGYSDVGVRLTGPYPGAPPFQWTYEVGVPGGLPQGPIVYDIQRQ
jgi:hypothetical protein